MSNKIVLHATDLDGFLKEDDKLKLSKVHSIYDEYLESCKLMDKAQSEDDKNKAATLLTENAARIGHSLEEICANEPQIHVYSFETPDEQHGAASRLIAKLRDPKTQHDEFVQPRDTSSAAQTEADKAMQEKIRHDVQTILIPRVFDKHPEYRQYLDDAYELLVNPTGKFVIGGPHGDTGLTGRKIIVDTYGGKGAHGGGAFSGKDPSKVDRSAAYAARHIAKNLVAAGVADEVLVQVSYAIGVARPLNVYVNTYNTAHVQLSDSEIAEKIADLFDLRPGAIERDLKLRNPIYAETAAYGHFGRANELKIKHFHSPYNTPHDIDIEVELFTWEKLDRVADLQKAFFGTK